MWTISWLVLLYRAVQLFAVSDWRPLMYCSLQQVLTTLQQQQLDDLSDWLRRMETLVSEDVSHEPLQKLLEKHKVSPVQFKFQLLTNFYRVLSMVIGMLLTVHLSVCLSVCLSRCGGTAAAVPPPFRPSEPALCGSCPLVTPYYCRLGDLLCFVFIVRLLFFCYWCTICVPSVLW